MEWVLFIIKFVIPVLLALGNIHQYLYNKNPKYYFFFLKRFKKWRDTKWQVHANYSVCDEVLVFEILEEAIESVFGDFQKVVNMSNKKQYNFGDFSLLVLYDADVSQSRIKKFDLNFNPVNVTYHTAKARLSELRKLFSEIEKNINSTKTRYSMDIAFTNNRNPFYGLMVQRLGRQNLEYFECVFDINTLKQIHYDNTISRKENKLRIFKEKVNISEESFDTIENVSLEILLMG